MINDRVYHRSATAGGDAKMFRHDGVPTIEFGFGTQTAHRTDEYTTERAVLRSATSYAIVPVLYAEYAADG